MFDTYGPYLLRTHDEAGIGQLYTEIGADAEKAVENAVGIYIVASNPEGDNWIPSYVGMTTRGFGQRIKEHLKSKKFLELAEKGSLRVHLIALRTKLQGQWNFVASSELSAAQEIVIQQLEQLLIDHCIRLNKELLLNVHRSSKNQIHVPGFLDKGDTERPSGAAKELAKLLKP